MSLESEITALVAAAFHGGDTRSAAELRQREKVLGTTMDSRRDLRIRYPGAAAKHEHPPVTRSFTHETRHALQKPRKIEAVILHDQHALIA